MFKVPPSPAAKVRAKPVGMRAPKGQKPKSAPTKHGVKVMVTPPRSPRKR